MRTKYKAGKYCGVICEYNPFHSGHRYQLQQVLRICDPDGIICVMSGDFVQRAQPAICDKYMRTSSALTYADAVIQLPTAYSLLSAEKFAEAGVRILGDIPGLTHLAFGCETEDGALLSALAEIQLSRTGTFVRSLHAQLDAGISYPAALTEATVESYLNHRNTTGQCETSLARIVKDTLTKPNNILAIEYIKAIQKFRPHLQPVPIHRKGGYHDQSLTGTFASASALRAAFSRRDPLAQNFIPAPLYAHMCEGNRPDIALWETVVLARLRAVDTGYLSRLFDCGEGIEHKLLKNLRRCVDLEHVILRTKSKRYTYARIRRMVVQGFFGITKALIQSFDNRSLPARILGIRNDKRPLLSVLPPHIFSKVKDMETLEPACKSLLAIDAYAANLYQLLCGVEGDPFYEKRLLTP